eukprot:545061-Pyramimonas_sp.AAC.2
MRDRRGEVCVPKVPREGRVGCEVVFLLLPRGGLSLGLCCHALRDTEKLARRQRPRGTRMWSPEQG